MGVWEGRKGGREVGDEVGGSVGMLKMEGWGEVWKCLKGGREGWVGA